MWKEKASTISVSSNASFFFYYVFSAVAVIAFFMSDNGLHEWEAKR